jgi:surface antigen
LSGSVHTKWALKEHEIHAFRLPTCTRFLYKERSAAFARERIAEASDEVEQLPSLSKLPLAMIVLALSACAGANGSTPEKALAPLNQSMLDGELAEMLDNGARRKAVTAEYAALEAGQTGLPVQWKDSDTVFGSVVPQQPYAVGASNCRRYVHTVSSNGQARSVVGTACRNESGAWHPLS